MDKVKPFDISKREVWEAFKRVKANRGAAGVDGQSCVFRTKVTVRFGIVTGDFGNVTGRFGNVTERTGRQDWRCA